MLAIKDLEKARSIDKNDNEIKEYLTKFTNHIK